MRVHQWIGARVGKGMAVALGLAVSVGLIAFSHSRAAAQAEPKIEATIFSYDGKDFVRTKTTLVTEDGSRPSTRSSIMPLRRIRPWSRNTRTLGMPRYSAISTMPIMHRSPVTMAN
jgi:hypothetical protein